jgi:ubiquinone/menaquinone biosynthesis C-methylase UbiE
MDHEQARKSAQYLQRTEIHTQWESDYLNRDMNRFYDVVFEDMLKQLQPKHTDSLLDAGCGYCYHTVRLSRGGEQITAVDFSEAALAIAQRTIASAGIVDQVSLEKADLTQLRFPNNSFDFVVSWGVIMHVPEMEKALSELARVLKPGGTLVLYENNMHSLDVMIREKAIDLAKKLLGRELPDIKRTPRGLEVWKQGETGGLMVRKTDMNYLTNFLAEQGLGVIKRVAGQFTEAYTNMPTRPLKRLVYALNSLYFQYVRIPQPAIGNIIYFRKMMNPKRMDT